MSTIMVTGIFRNLFLKRSGIKSSDNKYDETFSGKEIDLIEKLLSTSIEKGKIRMISSKPCNEI